ncbi:Uncharacterised protein [uncultured archaeon]|nr:Uncharacterised protein [uncultured archaeon]
MAYDIGLSSWKKAKASASDGGRDVHSGGKKGAGAAHKDSPSKQDSGDDAGEKEERLDEVKEAVHASSSGGGKKAAVSGGQTGNLLGDIKVLEEGGKTGIIIEAKEIEIPTGSVEIVERGGLLRIRGPPGGFVSIQVGLEGVVDVKKIKDHVESRRSVASSDEGQTVIVEDEEEAPRKESHTEIKLLDLRKEFRDQLDGETEGGPDSGLNEAELGLLERVIFKAMNRHGAAPGKAGLDLDKLKKLSLENLARSSQLRNKRDAINSVAYTLKQFLQIRFGIKDELTYKEMARKLRDFNIKEDLKAPVITCFNRIADATYSDDADVREVEENLSGLYDMAKHVITELS